ncbi:MULTISPECIES: 3-hydroxyacyl-CoA dehydrogenase [Hyphomicrobiales]|jgi:3-hydroxyacyl-CoA dehydrogenase|uniref:3-hydroxyacyl-CoA dehydrogenase NAD-binding n=2 Tax=Brucella/Ochrobactrum group TaxID=2826938 RepID=A6X836_BRUA4|nr:MULTISPECIES: 3-hydroxyacyl-CoA dehydrogenase [Hyphomicrobiales]AIH15741.1 3-hydroxybutyryl-CoA dehydrogenase [Ochrobactrum sp. SJY1]PZU71215.1 MAG: 3-hydroxyacyl-CoA dehydrogenase [Rhizobium sp.]HCD83802.1 3-hydroxyacyl-CoA dehydrogenase [Agrobacterium sp.]ABS17390.1 3-hydroxyacyl-CoA dehydrogenase NAD-binding [Brucella anthropi ATCC 49188]KAB2730991.1 3-hydroxyacyl-CoA dehydrogenase [Brucella anthropi]
MTIATVTVLGTGILGAQIALQAAWHGFSVIAYDIDEAALAKGRGLVDAFALRLLEDIPGADGASAEAAKARIAWTDDLEAAAGAADLVIEAIPEKLELKRQVYARLGAAAPPRTIFVTNSSTLLPSAMAGSTGRPERFLALHFANEIWKHNVAEVMGHAGTDPAVYEQVVAFARAIGMVPIEIRKEKAGYVLNSLLVPFLSAASGLLVDGIADPQAIDRTWKIATGAPKGPFEIYDIVGLGTAWYISSNGDPKAQAFARYLKENYIDKGKMGVASGEGFYVYGK